MGILGRLFRPSKTGSSGLFNQANHEWQVMKDAFLRGDDRQAQNALLEVVRLCQEAIAVAPQKEGNAYVLLTNVLLRGNDVYGTGDEELLTKYAAACIHSWWILPHRGWPVTKRTNYEIGVRWYREVQQRLEKAGSTNAESTMAEYGSLYGKLVTSPKGYEAIKAALLKGSIASENRYGEVQLPDGSEAEQAELGDRISLSEAESREGSKDYSRGIESLYAIKEVLWAHWQYLRHGDEYGRQADFSYANLAEVDLGEDALKEAYSEGFVLGKVEAWQFVPGIPDANLIDAVFTGANLSKANFSGTNLGGTILTGADLTDANLAGSNVSMGSLAYAELVRANLTGTELQYASLEAANLTDAIGLTQEQIKAANIDELTRLPGYLEAPSRSGQDIAARNADLPPFTEAIRLKPQNAREYFYRGLAYFHDGQYQRAALDFVEAIHADPHNASACNHLGLAYAYDGQYELAVNSFGEIIRLNPEDALAYNSRANAYLNLQEYQSAIDDYSEAIHLDPQSSIFFSNRSRAYREQGKNLEADRDYARALELIEDN